MQVGGKGKDEMEEFCTENEQWKEVGFTNITLCELAWMDTKFHQQYIYAGSTFMLARMDSKFQQQLVSPTLRELTWMDSKKH